MQMLWMGFFGLVISQILMFKYSRDIMNLQFCINYTDDTEAIMSLKKFFIDRLSTPKSTTLFLLPEILTSQTPSSHLFMP